MAENQDHTDDQQVEAFDQALMAPLDAAYEHNPNFVDLENAEDLGIISKPLHDAILKGIGEDEYKRAFTAALMRANTRLATSPDGMSPDKMARVSYKNAFFAVTRKFQLESRDEELEKPDGALMRALSKVLRFRLHDGNIDGRHELQSMLARVGMKNPQRRLDLGDLSERLGKAEGDMHFADSDIETASNEKSMLESIPVDNTSISEGISKVVDMDNRRKQIQDYGLRVSEISKSIEDFAKLDEEISNETTRLFDAMEMDLDLSIYPELSASDAEIKKYRTDYEAFKSSNDFSPDKIKDFCDQKYIPMAQSVFPNISGRISDLNQMIQGLHQSKDVLSRQANSIASLLDKNAANDLPVSCLRGNTDYAVKALTAAKNTPDEAERFKKYDSIVAQVDKAAKSIKALGVSDKHSDAVDLYFSSCQSITSSVKGLEDTEYDYISRAIEALFLDLGAATADITDNSALKSAEASLRVEDGRSSLEDTFPGLKVTGNGDDITVEVRGVKSNFDHAARAAEKSLEYFESPENLPTLEGSAKILTASIAKATSVRTAGDGIMKADGTTPLVKSDASIPDKIRALTDHAAVNRGMAQKTGRDAPKDDEQQIYMDKAIEAGTVIEAYKDLVSDTAKFHAELASLVKHLAFAEKTGVQIYAGGKKLKMLGDDGIEKDFERFSLKSFSLEDVNKLNSLFKNKIHKTYLQDAPLAKFTSELDKAKGELSSCANLTDDEVSKRVIATLVAKENPGMTLEKQQDLAALILAGDVATLQAKESYTELAQKAGAEVLQAASIGNTRALIDFQYSVGGKVIKPFLGLKPKDFQNVDKVMRLFDTGILNSKTGFILLAAFESFEGGKNSGLYNAAAEKLKKLIAKDLGVEKRLHISGIRRVVEDAFEDQLNATKPFVTEVFNWHSMNVGDWDISRINALNNDFKALQEDAAREDVKDESVLTAKLQTLLKEAKEHGVEGKVDFSADSLTAGFKNSKYFRSLEGFGHDLGDTSKRKTIGFGKGSTKGLAEGSARGAGAFALLGLNSAFRLGRMASGFAVRTLFSPFRAGMWNKAKSNASANWTGFRGGFSPFRGRIKKSFGSLWGHISGEVGKEKWKKSTRAERSDVTPTELRSLSAEYRKNAEFKPFEINDEPFVSMDPYKERIKQVDEMLKAKAKAA